MLTDGVMKGTIAVAGLGLMGGSLALALQESTPVRVLGIDRSPDVIMQAVRRRAIDDPANPETLAETDMLVLALPPSAAVRTLRETAPLLKKGAIVTDMCGIKRTVCAQCEPICREYGLYFVGGHPMAGREKSGFAHADGGLYDGASYIVTPADDTPPEVLEAVRALAVKIGCSKFTVTTPEIHDRMIAFTSQLPHLLASCYTASPQNAQTDGFTAGSYRDISRVAEVNEALWSELYLDNADMLAGELEGMIGRLSAFRDALNGEDRLALTRLIAEGKAEKADTP